MTTLEKIHYLVFIACVLGIIFGLAYGEYSTVFAVVALVLNECCSCLEEKVSCLLDED